MPVIVAGHPHGGGLGRRHRDALDAGRRDEPRQLHLQRPADAQLRRGPRRLRGGGRARAAARPAGPRARGRAARAARARAGRRRARALLGGARASCAGARRCAALDARRRARAIAIGAKTFTEQYILSRAARGADRGSDRPRRRAALPSLGSTVAFDALARGRDRRLRRLLRHDLGDDHAPRRSCPRAARAVLAEVDAASCATSTAIAVAARARLRERLRARDARRRTRASSASRASATSPRTRPRFEIGGDYEFFARPEWRALAARLRPRASARSAAWTRR